MDEIDLLIQRVKKTEHGFIDIQKAASEFRMSHSTDACLKISKKLFLSENYQSRSLATFILGFIAYDSVKALGFLKSKVSKDDDWRVQEILAKAFDRYCFDIGYKNALPEIKDWLSDKNPNVVRAVTEGLRIWTGRDYFKDNPNVAIELLSTLKDHESEYVRKSVGNALKDISKKNKESVRREIETWDISDKKINQTYKLASKFTDKNGS